MSMETWKPRRFVEEFQKRAGLLIDGKPGPQTQIALELVPELPPGRLYPAVPEMPERLRAKTDAPTPIDPADIRPGDVVERALIDRITVTEHDGWAIRGRRDNGSRAGLGILGPENITVTWHLVHRPDPDAEAVEAIRAAMIAGPSDTSGLPYVRNILQELREQGWDVTRRQNGQEHA